MVATTDLRTAEELQLECLPADWSGHSNPSWERKSFVMGATIHHDEHSNVSLEGRCVGGGGGGGSAPAVWRLPGRVLPPLPSPLLMLHSGGVHAHLQAPRKRATALDGRGAARQGHLGPVEAKYLLRNVWQC